MKNNFGFTLIEVLISLLLFALILLAFDVMQFTAWRLNRSAYYLTVASFQVISMSERLKELGDGLGLQDQIAIWHRQNQLILPMSKGIVTGNYPIYTIELCWGMQKKINCLHKKVAL